MEAGVVLTRTARNFAKVDGQWLALDLAGANVDGDNEYLLLAMDNPRTEPLYFDQIRMLLKE